MISLYCYNNNCPYCRWNYFSTIEIVDTVYYLNNECKCRHCNHLLDTDLELDRIVIELFASV